MGLLNFDHERDHHHGGHEREGATRQIRTSTTVRTLAKPKPCRLRDFDPGDHAVTTP